MQTIFNPPGYFQDDFSHHLKKLINASKQKIRYYKNLQGLRKAHKGLFSDITIGLEKSIQKEEQNLHALNERLLHHLDIFEPESHQERIGRHD